MKSEYFLPGYSHPLVYPFLEAYFANPANFLVDDMNRSKEDGKLALRVQYESHSPRNLNFWMNTNVRSM